MSKFKRSAFFCAIFLASAFVGCSTPDEPPPANPKPEAPADTRVNSNINAAAPETAAVPSLATPSDAYRAAHEYRKNKDIAGLKQVLSKEVLDFLAEVAKAGNKTVDDALRELVESPSADTAEVRNESIVGDRAVVEYKDENGLWNTMDLINEDGKWKLALPDEGPPENVTRGTGK